VCDPMGFAQFLLDHLLAIAALAYTGYILSLILYRLYFSPLAKFPGPSLAACTSWYEFYYDAILFGKYTFEIAKMHKEYGKIFLDVFLNSLKDSEASC